MISPEEMERIRRDRKAAIRRERKASGMDECSNNRRVARKKERYNTDPEYKRYRSEVMAKQFRNRNQRRDARTPPKPPNCPICLLPFEPTGPRKAVWDHDHRGGHFRGWICCFDNRGLGIFADDPERLRRAAAYLELDRARNPLKPWQEG